MTTHRQIDSCQACATILRALLFAVVALASGAAAAFAGQDSPDHANFRAGFDRIIAEGERHEIPWSVKLSRPLLRLDQRLGVNIEIELSNSTLNRTAAKHDLAMTVRMSGPGGQWLPGFSQLAKQLDQPLPARTSLMFIIRAIVIPGEYRVGIVLVDRISGRRSVALRPLRVKPLAPDPLPQAFRGFPPVEFLPAGEGLDEVMQPELQGRLFLPVQTRRPVRIEVLANFSHSEEFMGPRPQSGAVRAFSGPLFRQRGARVWRGSRPKPEENLAQVLSALKPLSEISIHNGSLRISGLDLSRRNLIFEQENAQRLDWPRLRDALAQFNANVITAEALAARKENAAFFREMMEQRLWQAAAEPAPASLAAGAPAFDEAASEPVRVFIVLSSGMLFVPGSQPAAVAPAAACDCRVYHLRLMMLGNVWDELDDILRPLKPRRFEIRSPADYRRALAAILRELNEY